MSQALDYARQSVELADRSGDTFRRVVNRTTLADALHQSGELPEAESLFREAEDMQKESQPESFCIIPVTKGFLHKRTKRCIKELNGQNYILSRDGR